MMLEMNNNDIPALKCTKNEVLHSWSAVIGSKLESVKPQYYERTPLSKVQVGDYVEFGHTNRTLIHPMVKRLLNESYLREKETGCL